MNNTLRFCSNFLAIMHGCFLGAAIMTAALGICSVEHAIMFSLGILASLLINSAIIYWTLEGVW
jgi:hypothetical protein